MAGPISNDYVSMINKKGSGYNIPVIVEAIVNSEIDPIKSNVTSKKVAADAAISGLAGLKSSAKLTQTAINTLSSLNDYSLTTSTTGTLTMTAGDSSSISSFSKNISNVRIAKAQILSVNNFNASDVGAPGAQTLTIVVGPDALGNSATSTVNIIATDNVLSIAEKINNIVGLKGEVIDTGIGTTPLRLQITGELGTVGNFTIASSRGAVKMSTTPHASNTAVQNSRNASLVLDGVTINRPTNTISDLVGGVIINLLQDDTAATTKITSTLSSASVEASVKSLMNELNLYKADMDALGFVDAVGDADGELAQNSYLRSAQRQFQKLISTPILGYNGDGILRAGSPNQPVHFVDFGIKTSRDGTLAFDQATFSRTFTKEPWKFDALTQDVAYSTDPNVMVNATPTSGMPAGGHAFANHQRVLPTSGTASIGGFRSFNDKLVSGTTIRYQQTPHHISGAFQARDHSITTQAGESVSTFIGRLNALPGLHATADTSTGTPAIRSIKFRIDQNPHDQDLFVDPGTALTMTAGDLSNEVTGVPIIRRYGHFSGPSEVLPTQSFVMNGTLVRIPQDATTPATLANYISSHHVGLSAFTDANGIVITGPNTGAAIEIANIRNTAGTNSTGTTLRPNVVAQGDSVGGMQTTAPTDESWQDTVTAIPSNGSFTKVDLAGNNSSSVGSGAGTYSSGNYPGFQFTTTNDQAAMYLYVGRSVRTLVNNFFTDALKSSATHQKVSNLYSDSSSGLAKRLIQIDAREELLRSRYTQQFAAMEKVVTQGGSTSEYLDSMVASWNKS